MNFAAQDSLAAKLARATRAIALGARPPLWLLAATAQDTQGVLGGRLKDLCAHLRPQCDDLTGRATGRVRLLRFERLAEDFALLQKDRGLPGRPLPRENGSSARSPTAAQAARATLVARVYDEHYRLFGYDRGSARADHGHARGATDAMDGRRSRTWAPSRMKIAIAAGSAFICKTVHARVGPARMHLPLP